MNYLSNNIRYLRKKHSMSQNDLAENLGRKSYTTIQKWETGVAEPPLKVAHAIAALFGVDIDTLTNVDLARGNSSASSLPSGAFPVPDAHKIPLLGRIAAGLPLYAEQNLEGYIWTDKNHGREYFGLKVVGDSMNAAGIKDGDVVIVQRVEVVEENDIAVVLIDDEATIKRVKTSGDMIILTPQSTNPDNHVQIYSLKDHSARIIGKVVESRTAY